MKRLVLPLFVIGLATAALLDSGVERRLSLPDPTDVNFYTTQIQNTHSMMNNIKNQDKRQTELRSVANQFGVLSSRLDSFREALFRKLGELHMSLERPKVAMSSPGPISLNPLANPLISKNRFTSSMVKNFESSEPAPAFATVNNHFDTVSPATNQAKLPSLTGALGEPPMRNLMGLPYGF